mmetsp:Transcript_39211/g.79187  ORF Transcript_39211/g.79187 Transcript_39211/m.79187 type:complete len:380 (+) Transcript_39211:90-1229(+)
MTNYSAWDSKADALVKEAEEEEKHEEVENNKVLGLEGGPKGPTTAKAKAEMKDMGRHSNERQDFIDWSKSREVKITHTPQEEPIELSSDGVVGKALRFSESEGVTYILPTGSIKVMLDKCRRVQIRVLGTITTSTVEIYSCDDLEVEFHHPVGTLQVDECTASVSVRFAERDHVGWIYHQNSCGLTVGWGGPGCEVHTVGVAGAVQLITRLNSASAKELFLTDAVRRDESEYPVEPQAGEQPEPEAAPSVEERRQRAEQQRQAGNDMFRANDFMQAAVHYTESLQLDPSIGAVWANRAQCWLKLGDHEKSLADAVRCTEVEPANPKGWFRKGLSLHAMKRFPEAIPALLEAEKLGPQNKQVVDAIKMAQMMAWKSAAGA